MSQEGTEWMLARMRRILRGDDKTWLAYNYFLATNKGLAADQDVTLLREVIYSGGFQAYRRYAMRSMNAAYLAEARRFHSEAVANVLNSKLGGKNMFYWLASGGILLPSNLVICCVRLTAPGNADRRRHRWR